MVRTYATFRNKNMIEIDILDQGTMYNTMRKTYHRLIKHNHFILEVEITKLSLKMNVRFILKVFYLI